MSLLKVIRANPHKHQLSGKNLKCSRELERHRQVGEVVTREVGKPPRSGEPGLAASGWAVTHSSLLRHSTESSGSELVTDADHFLAVYRQLEQGIRSC